MKKTMLVALLLKGGLLSAQITVNDIPDVTLNDGTFLNVDFNNDGTSEFSFEGYDMGPTLSVSAMFDATTTNFVTFGTTQTGEGWDVIKPLAAGTSIGAAGPYGAVVDAYINPGWAQPNELFPAGDSYVGTHFPLGGATYYGWILVSSNNGVITVKSYAYNTVAGASIVAGNNGTASIEERMAATVSVFPNPSTDFVEIASSEPVKQIVVCDVAGNGVLVPVSEQRLDTRGLRAGVYYAQVEMETGVSAVVRFVKR